MVGRCAISLRKNNSEWLRSLLHSKYYGICVDHRHLRRNEKNVFCIDCNMCCCKHCFTTTCTRFFHRRLQICRYVYHDVVRLQDIQTYFDCSEIQTYKINGEMAIHLNSRPKSKDIKQTKLKINSTVCQACRRHIHDLPNRFCSIACKVQVAVEMPKDGSGHEMICTSDREDYDSDRSSNERYEAKEDRNVDESSCSPLTDQSSEVIQCSWSSTSVSKPKNHLSLHVHKRRKGIPYRAPLR